MPYAPSVNDRSGEILANASTNAAALQMQAMQSLGQSFANLGDSFNDSLQQSRERTAKLEGLQATGQAMQNILPQYGEEGMALANSLAQDLQKAGNNPDKQAGVFMAYQPAVQNIQSRYNQQVQYDAALELHRQKQALGGSGGAGANAMPDVFLDY